MKRRRNTAGYVAPSGLRGYRSRRRRNSVGVLERRNPIPPGRYWMDPTGNPAIDKVDAWLAEHNTTVVLTASEYDDGEQGRVFKDPPTQFVIFEVKQPTPSNGLPSFPNVAPPEIQSMADTVRRPPPEKIPGILDTLAMPFEGAGLLLALWVLYEISKER